MALKKVLEQADSELGPLVSISSRRFTFKKLLAHLPNVIFIHKPQEPLSSLCPQAVLCKSFPEIAIKIDILFPSYLLEDFLLRFSKVRPGIVVNDINGGNCAKEAAYMAL